MKIQLALYFLIIIFISSCVPADNTIITEVSNSITNEEYRKVYDFQDRQDLDSIFSFMHHTDPTFRFQTANAMASMKDNSLIDSLILLLDDDIPTVQQAAAYALGQIGDSAAESHLLSALNLVDTIDYNNSINRSIMEAIGKCGSLSTLESLSTASNINPSDDEILLGQALGIYRFWYNQKLSSPSGTARMVELLTQPNIADEVRYIAANYLSRANDIDLEKFKFQLTKSLQSDGDVRVRIALANAMRHLSDEEVQNTMLDVLDSDTDYRVKVNILRSLGSFPYINSIEKILNTLKHDNLHVAKSAAQYLINHGQPADASLYAGYINDELDWSVKSLVYGSILKHLPRNFSRTRFRINAEITKLFNDAEDPYERRGYLESLSNDVVNFKIINDLAATDSSIVVKSGAISGFGKILASDGFAKAYRTTRSQSRIKTEILNYLKTAIEKGSTGEVTAAAAIVANESFGLASLDYDFGFIQNTINKLELPKEWEAYKSLQQTQAIIEGKAYNEETPEHNHPIDWEILSGISDSTRAIIKTNKGDVTLKFYVNQAPGTVANFINLANSNFYDGKAFHRVVPSFVIQGGCPIGDGSGSLDYTIRSELPQLYYNREGKVGMASAGNHTEGVQFFITHAPAPHLDGNYTIFADVVDGMDTVHAIQVGDKITDVQIF